MTMNENSEIIMEMTVFQLVLIKNKLKNKTVIDPLFR